MKQSLAIFPFRPTDREYLAITAVWNAAVRPDLPRPVNDFRDFDASLKPGAIYHRLIGRLGRRIVAVAHYGQPLRSDSHGAYFLDFSIDPQVETDLMAEKFYRTLEEALAPYDAALITSQARENQVIKVRRLEGEGFRLVMRENRSLLEVDSFDRARFQGIEERTSDLGIRMISVAEWLASGPEAMRALWDLDWALLQDVPVASGEHYRMPLADFGRRMRSWADTSFVALDGEALIALTTLRRSDDDPAVAHAGLTGVLPAYRRRGVATALKLRGIAFAAQAGIGRIATFNEENNPMYLLNLKLGFKPLPARLFFEKRLASPPG